MSAPRETLECSKFNSVNHINSVNRVNSLNHVTYLIFVHVGTPPHYLDI